jgi:hypothetical protein
MSDFEKKVDAFQRACIGGFTNVDGKVVGMDAAKQALLDEHTRVVALANSQAETLARNFEQYSADMKAVHKERDELKAAIRARGHFAVYGNCLWGGPSHDNYGDPCTPENCKWTRCQEESK